MLYANDLIIITESLEELNTWYAAWKHFMECKGLRLNLAKTKVGLMMYSKNQTLPKESTHVESVLRVLAQTPSFTIILLAECISVVMD